MGMSCRLMLQGSSETVLTNNLVTGIAVDHLRPPMRSEIHYAQERKASLSRGLWGRRGLIRSRNTVRGVEYHS